MLETTKSFSIIDENRMGSVELSRVFANNCDWFYFNRLFVPRKIRRRGIASKLLEQLVIWADNEKVNIYLPINPYGDEEYGLDLEGLVELYSKYGFKLIQGKDGSMYRLWNGNPQIITEDFFDDLFELTPSSFWKITEF